MNNNSEGMWKETVQAKFEEHPGNVPDLLTNHTKTSVLTTISGRDSNRATPKYKPSLTAR
jgi:hypothetical protein